MLKLLSLVVAYSRATDNQFQIPPVGVNIKALGSEVGASPPPLDLWLTWELTSFLDQASDRVANVATTTDFAETQSIWRI